MVKNGSKNGGKPAPHVQRQIRMSRTLLDQIHRYQKKVQKETGAEIRWSSVVRSLIERGLKELA